MNFPHSPAKTLVFLMVIGMLSGCSGLPTLSFPGVYRINIPQGNLITQEMVDQLRPGLTKRQVTFIMGTPLIKDTFDQNRWDYIYSIQIGGGERMQERLSVYFEDDMLVRFDGDFTQTPEKEQFTIPEVAGSPTTESQAADQGTTGNAEDNSQASLR